MRYRLLRNISVTREAFVSVTTLNEGPWRWALGVQAAIATGVPVALFTLSHHPVLGSMASLGGYTVLYGSGRPLGQRLVAMLLVALGFGLASLLGVWVGAGEWLTLIGLILVAVLASIGTIGTGLGPPGAVMFVLVAAVSSQLATQPRPVNHLEIPLYVMAGALMAWVITVLLSAIPFFQKNYATAPLPVLTLHVPMSSELLRVTMRIVSGVLIAALVSKLVGVHRAYWVIVAATAVLQTGFNRRLTTIRALHRVFGTVIGVAVFELIHWLHPQGIFVVLFIMLLQFGTQTVVARNYVLGLMFITPMALISVTMSHALDDVSSVRERVVDTLLGAGVAIIVFWLEEQIRIWRSRIFSGQ